MAIMNDFGEIVKRYGLVAVGVVIFLYFLFSHTSILEEIWRKYDIFGVMLLFISIIALVYFSEKVAFVTKQEENQQTNIQSLFNDSFKLMLNNHTEFQQKIERFFENLLESQFEMQKSMEVIKQRIIELDRDFNVNMDKIYAKLYDSITKETFNELFLLYVDRIFLRVLEKFVETLNILDNCKGEKECIRNILNLFKSDIKGIIKEMAKSFFVRYQFNLDKEYYNEIKVLLFSFAEEYADDIELESCNQISNWKNCMLKKFLEYTKKRIREEIVLKMSNGGGV